VGPIRTPSLATIGQEITTGLQQGALPGGADQWNSFFDPTAGQQVAQNLNTGQSLIWDSTNDAWVAPLPEVVISATREPTAQQYEADQQQLANQSNALAAEVFGSFGPYALAKGIYNGAVGATADAAYIDARLFGASTQTADAWASYIDRAQVSPGALEQAMGQSASPYLQSGYQSLASVVGSTNADDLSHLAGLGLNSLAVLPAAESLSTVGSSLRESIGQLGDLFPSGSAGSFGAGGAPPSMQLGQLDLSLPVSGSALEAAPMTAENSAALNQLASGYNADAWSGTTLKQGTIIYQLTPGTTPYFTDLATAQASGFDSFALSRSLQVNPHPIYGYRPNITGYLVTQDISVPSGVALANPQFGPGGGAQFFIENYQNILKPVATVDLSSAGTQYLNLTSVLTPVPGAQ